MQESSSAFFEAEISKGKSKIGMVSVESCTAYLKKEKSRRERPEA